MGKEFRQPRRNMGALLKRYVQGVEGLTVSYGRGLYIAPELRHQRVPLILRSKNDIGGGGVSRHLNDTDSQASACFLRGAITAL